MISKGNLKSGCVQTRRPGEEGVRYKHIMVQIMGKWLKEED